ncbi:MAG: hypothetical protein QM708_00275 [Propioniciclava sp.]|uniref:FitA-like ribbon-helix-helix domain-containing protein n=1 Tax=Propioniciclava sp. TaxID=2038686 RepID=UPI0039E52846
MSVTITIRNVPDEVHAVLITRATHSGLSLQEYLLAELTKLASTPGLADQVGRARENPQSYPALSADDILAAIEDARR